MQFMLYAFQVAAAPRCSSSSFAQTVTQHLTASHVSACSWTKKGDSSSSAAGSGSDGGKDEAAGMLMPNSPEHKHRKVRRWHAALVHDSRQRQQQQIQQQEHQQQEHLQ